MTRLIVDAAGWMGAVALLSAYALVSSGRMHGRGPYFQVLNLLGATGLLANGIYHDAWPSAGLNAVWLVVGFTALLRPRPLPVRSVTAAQCGTPDGQRSDSTPTDR